MTNEEMCARWAAAEVRELDNARLEEEAEARYRAECRAEAAARNASRVAGYYGLKLRNGYAQIAELVRAGELTEAEANEARVALEDAVAREEDA